MDNYLVLSADVVSSKSHLMSIHFREDLISKLELFYKANSKVLGTRMRLSRGDEIQCIITEIPQFAAVLRRLRYFIRPLEIRVGFGVGSVTTPVDTDDPWQMDGPAFHRARQSLMEAKSLKWTNTYFLAGDNQLDRRINLVLMMIDAIQERWTRAQWEAVDAYEQFKTLKSAGEQLNISYQNVNKRCLAAKWPVIREAEVEIGLWTKELLF
jgi:hypothetical protein